MIVNVAAVVLALIGLIFAQATGELAIEKPEKAKKVQTVGMTFSVVLVALALLCARAGA